MALYQQDDSEGSYSKRSQTPSSTHIYKPYIQGLNRASGEYIRASKDEHRIEEKDLEEIEGEIEEKVRDIAEGYGDAAYASEDSLIKTVSAFFTRVFSNCKSFWQ